MFGLIQEDLNQVIKLKDFEEKRLVAKQKGDDCIESLNMLLTSLESIGDCLPSLKGDDKEDLKESFLQVTGGLKTLLSFTQLSISALIASEIPFTQWENDHEMLKMRNKELAKKRRRRSDCFSDCFSSRVKEENEREFTDSWKKKVLMRNIEQGQRKRFLDLSKILANSLKAISQSDVNDLMQNLENVPDNIAEPLWNDGPRVLDHKNEKDVSSQQDCCNPALVQRCNSLQSVNSFNSFNPLASTIQPSHPQTYSSNFSSVRRSSISSSSNDSGLGTSIIPRSFQPTETTNVSKRFSTVKRSPSPRRSLYMRARPESPVSAKRSSRQVSPPLPPMMTGKPPIPNKCSWTSTSLGSNASSPKESIVDESELNPEEDKITSLSSEEEFSDYLDMTGVIMEKGQSSIFEPRHCYEVNVPTGYV